MKESTSGKRVILETSEDEESSGSECPHHGSHQSLFSTVLYPKPDLALNRSSIFPEVLLTTFPSLSTGGTIPYRRANDF